MTDSNKPPPEPDEDPHFRAFAPQPPAGWCFETPEDREHYKTACRESYLQDRLAYTQMRRQLFLDGRNQVAEFIREVVNAGAKSLILVNGAAAISLLTFIGNPSGGSSGLLIYAMMAFPIGAVFGVLVFVAGYIAERAEIYLLDSGWTDMAKLKTRDQWSNIGLGFAVLSIFAFSVGICLAGIGFLDRNPWIVQ